MNTKFISLAVAFLLCALCSASGDIEKEEFEGQEFLFLTEEAYTQQKGQWQISISSQYFERKKSKEADEVKLRNQWQWTAEVEYGLSNWLQFEVEIPFQHVHKKTTEDDEITHLGETGISDVETGLKIKLFDENDDTWLSHTVSAGFELTWPSGRWRKDLGSDRIGWEACLSVSKTFDKWAYHLTGGFGFTNDAREQGESSTSDETEYEVAAALVYSPAETFDLICELIAEFERETSNTSESHRDEIYALGGVKCELFDDFEAGIGIPIGLTSKSYDWGLIVKIQYEW